MVLEADSALEKGVGAGGGDVEGVGEFAPLSFFVLRSRGLEWNCGC
jgi:hypothetical protein